MLATVTERTCEIGVRRALGAKKKDFTMQFLVESVVLAIGGGLIGVAVGVLAPVIVSHLTDMKTIITLWSVMIAFSISGGVGILFGLRRRKTRPHRSSAISPCFSAATVFITWTTAVLRSKWPIFSGAKANSP